MDESIRETVEEVVQSAERFRTVAQVLCEGDEGVYEKVCTKFGKLCLEYVGKAMDQATKDIIEVKANPGGKKVFLERKQKMERFVANLDNSIDQSV